MRESYRFAAAGVDLGISGENAALRSCGVRDSAGAGYGDGGMLGTLIRKLNYSLNGLSDTWVSETSFRQWSFVVVVSDGLALYLFSVSFVTGVIVFAGFVLLAAELSNTAIEAVVDRVDTQWHALARKAKDAGSAMVFLTFIGLLTVWVFALLDARAG